MKISYFFSMSLIPDISKVGGANGSGNIRLDGHEAHIQPLNSSAANRLKL
jgi:hypothetical protein